MNEEGLRRVLDDDEPSVEPRVPPAYGDPGAEPLVGDVVGGSEELGLADHCHLVAARGNVRR
ncbi:MAG: hypothetical protein ACR2K6_00970 [Solirubrobacterales bacterium]